MTPPTASVPEGSKPQGVEQDEFSFVEMAYEAKLLHLAFWLPYCSVFLSILNVGKSSVWSSASVTYGKLLEGEAHR